MKERRVGKVKEGGKEEAGELEGKRGTH